MPKLAVIIGAGPGIAQSVADKLASSGYDLALVSRSSVKLSILTDQIRSKLSPGLSGISIQTYTADASDPTSLQATLDHISSSSAPEVVIYNAARVGQSKLQDTTLETFDTDFRTNVQGAFITAKWAEQVFNKNKTTRGDAKATLIFTGGGLSTHPRPTHVTLSLGKAALRNLTLNLHNALKDENIHVATVTVCGLVSPDAEKHKPVAIAEQYIKLISQSKPEWEAEITF